MCQKQAGCISISGQRIQNFTLRKPHSPVDLYTGRGQLHFLLFGIAYTLICYMCMCVLCNIFALIWYVFFMAHGGSSWGEVRGPGRHSLKSADHLCQRRSSTPKTADITDILDQQICIRPWLSLVVKSSVTVYLCPYRYINMGRAIQTVFFICRACFQLLKAYTI